MPEQSDHPAQDIPDPFALLGLPRRFEIDDARLERAWLKAAARSHPDRAGDESMQTQAALNDAKEQLADPEKRARVLFELIKQKNGLEEDPADASALPDGFLEQTMQERMEIDEALGAEDRAEIDRLIEETKRREDGLAAETGELLEKLPEQHGLLGEVRVRLNAWRYVRRMVERLTGEDGLD